MDRNYLCTYLLSLKNNLVHITSVIAFTAIPGMIGSILIGERRIATTVIKPAAMADNTQFSEVLYLNIVNSKGTVTIGI